MEKEKILIIVDFQKDFYDAQNGSLYVNGAEEALENIKKYINENNILGAFLTMDWHNSNDESFKEYGGQWPIHCLQYSAGAGIHDDLLKVLINKNIPYQFFKKGMVSSHEEYGAFETRLEDEFGQMKDGALLFSDFSDMSTAGFLPNFEYVICGLAGDYCVYESYKNLKKHNVNVIPFYEGMGFIGEKFDFEERFNSETE